MKKDLFTKLSLALGILAASFGAQAQTQPLSSGNILGNISNARLIVNTPASISGLKKVTLASWGAPASPVMTNIPVVRGLDSLANLPLTNAAAIAGKFCLLYRGGGVTFAQKASYAYNAGAIGVIIVNNISGDPVAMGNTGTATVNIPIIMVSDVDGNAMNNQLRNSVPVTISLGSWGLGVTHDLGIVPGFQGTPHALNVPLSQMSKSANKFQYKNWIGGAIANYGTATETNVSVSDSILFTPTGSSTAAFVSTHSYNLSSIAPLDSIKFGFGAANTSYYLAPPATTGRYDYNYRLTFGNTDQIPQDNVYTMSQYVNDSIFCKSRYDYTKMEPYVSQGIQPASAANPFVMGPMFYVTNGGYGARKIQFYLSKGTGNPLLDGSEVFALVFKWQDGTNGGDLDSIMVGSELTMVGQTYNKFTSNDSSGKVYSLNVSNPINSSPVVLDSNSWYWVCIQSPNDCFIGVDEGVNYFTRSFIQSQQNKYMDYPEGAFFNDHSTLLGSNNAVVNFPFGGNALNIDSTFYDRYNQIPAIALHITKNKVPTSVGKVSTAIGKASIYPNPASNYFDVEVDLAKSTDKLGLRLLDQLGRVVMVEDHNQVQKDRYRINTSAFAAGNYYLFITTDAGAITQKVVITR